ncbi:MAG: DUF5072 family protein [Clostridia bacterium]|jgi:hypothetical protein|nr:DUF5072 family protein [Clostridia bacterium]
MLKKLAITDLLATIQKQIEKNTNYPCIDNPINQKSPFYYMELINKQEANTKTMWCEKFSVVIHVISEPFTGNTQNYDMISALEEAMTEELSLPEPYTVISQVETGINARQTDETGEKHSVILFEITVCYGYRIK